MHSSHQNYAPTSATISFYLSDQKKVSSPPVTVLSISLYKTSDRAASVPRSI